MNFDTRVAVSCFSGDQQQIEQSLDLYLHHGCPVTILSPEDAQVTSVVSSAATVDFRSAGKRGRAGPVPQARHLEYFKILLAYPENFFLIHESDSVCLDPEIPAYLYAEPATFWCNAQEAPWFLSRAAMERMLAVAPSVRYDGEWVDRYQIALANAAGVPVKMFLNSFLGPISGRFDPETGQLFIPHGAERFGPEGSPVPPDLSKVYEDHFQGALAAARNGANMIHSVKNGDAAHALADAYIRPIESPTPPLSLRRRRAQAAGIGQRA